MKKQLSFLMLLAALIVPQVASAQNCTQNVPFSEGFESTTANTSYSTAGSVPTCWNAYSNGTSTSYVPHVVSGTGSYIYRKSGDNSIVMTSGSSTYGSVKYVVLPPMSVALNQLQLSFWMCTESNTNGVLTVGYLTSDDTSTFTTIQTYPASAATVHDGNGLMATAGLDVDLVLSQLPSTATRLAFKWEYTTSFYSCCIDDVVVDYIPTCPKVENLAVIATSTTADVAWTEMGTATQWEVALYDASGMVSSTIENTDAATITGLTPDADYTVSVRALCGAGDTSYARSMTFHTACVPLTSTNLPYNYGFEDATGSGATYDISSCWGRYHQGGTTNYPNPSTGQHHNGEYSLYFNNSSTITCWATLPPYDGDLSDLSVGFWAYKGSANYGHLKVGVMTNPDSLNTFTQVASLWVSATSTWEYFEFPLSSYTGDGIYVAILSDSNGTNYTYVDDVTLMVTPTCSRPVSAAVSDLTTTGATLTITDPTNVGSYLVQVTGDTVFSIIVSGTVYEFDDLQANMQYNLAVASICSDGNATSPV